MNAIVSRGSLIGLAFAGLALAMLAAPPAATAQLHVSLYGRSGLLAPDTYFYEVYENFLEGATEWSTGSLGRSPVAGAGIEVALGESGVLVRAEVVRSFDSWVRVSHSRVTPRVLFIPPEIVTDWYDVPFNVTLTSVELVLPTKLRLWGAQPYVAMGGGGKYYQFGETTEPNTTEALLPTDGFTWAVDAGAGVMIPLFWDMSADLQARTAVSRYWSKTQTDFLYSGALHVPLW